MRQSEHKPARSTARSLLTPARVILLWAYPGVQLVVLALVALDKTRWNTRSTSYVAFMQLWPIISYGCRLTHLITRIAAFKSPCLRSITLNSL